MPKLTILSFGAGQDSTAILYWLIYDKAFRKKYAPEDLVVIMAETGNEHPETYQHVKEVSELCKSHNVNFVHLDYTYTPAGWKGGLIEFYERTNTVGSKAFPKTCTDKLKIQPIYNFLEQFIHVRYHTEKVGRKRALKEFARKHGKIDVLIGIAKGEEKRICKNEDSPSVWMRETINKIYPLVELGMDRKACQKDIRRFGHKVPLPSNCILCPFMNMVELLYLYKSHPNWFRKWVELEQTKITNNTHMGVNNLSVWGNKLLLPQILEQAKDKHGDLTLKYLQDYVMSHGHCLMSKY
jgi:hypothetical protein